MSGGKWQVVEIPGVGKAKLKVRFGHEMRSNGDIDARWEATVKMVTKGVVPKIHAGRFFRDKRSGKLLEEFVKGFVEGSSETP